MSLDSVLPLALSQYSFLEARSRVLRSYKTKGWLVFLHTSMFFSLDSKEEGKETVD
jgi:hypothetical protein